MTLESSIEERELITKNNNNQLSAFLDFKLIIPIQELLFLLRKADKDYFRYQDIIYSNDFWDSLKKEFREKNPLSYKDSIKILFDSNSKKEREENAVCYAHERKQAIDDNLSNSIQKKELHSLLEDIYSIDGIKKMISIYQDEKKEVKCLLDFLLKNVSEKAKEGERLVQNYLNSGGVDVILKRLLQEEYPQGSESVVVYNEAINSIIRQIKLIVQCNIKGEYYNGNINFTYSDVKHKYLYPIAKEFTLIKVDIKKMEKIYRFLQIEIQKLDSE